MTAVSQAPGNLYSRICVISDIFPSEWPPVQVRKGVPHPLPTHMAYRAALARGLEPVTHGFRDMVNIAVASDSRMFRAALVRLAARASGLQHSPCALAPHPGLHMKVKCLFEWCCPCYRHVLIQELTQQVSDCIAIFCSSCPSFSQLHLMLGAAGHSGGS